MTTGSWSAGSGGFYVCRRKDILPHFLRRPLAQHGAGASGVAAVCRRAPLGHEGAARRARRRGNRLPATDPSRPAVWCRTFAMPSQKSRDLSSAAALAASPPPHAHARPGALGGGTAVDRRRSAVTRRQSMVNRTTARGCPCTACNMSAPPAVFAPAPSHEVDADGGLPNAVSLIKGGTGTETRVVLCFYGGVALHISNPRYPPPTASLFYPLGTDQRLAPPASTPDALARHVTGLLTPFSVARPRVAEPSHSHGLTCPLARGHHRRMAKTVIWGGGGVAARHCSPLVGSGARGFARQAEYVCRLVLLGVRTSVRLEKYMDHGRRGYWVGSGGGEGVWVPGLGLGGGGLAGPGICRGSRGRRATACCSSAGGSFIAWPGFAKLGEGHGDRLRNLRSAGALTDWNGHASPRRDWGLEGRRACTPPFVAVFVLWFSEQCTIHYTWTMNSVTHKQHLGPSNARRSFRQFLAIDRCLDTEGGGRANSGPGCILYSAHHTRSTSPHTPPACRVCAGNCSVVSQEC